MARRSARVRARHLFVLSLGLLVVAAAALSSPAGVSGAPAVPPVAARADRPNIVMVMADDMRVDDLRFAPNLRRLVARRGLTFENSFSPYPLCCPARASFLTGVYAHNHEVFWHDAPFGYGAFDDSRTLATSLKSVGYSTGFVGKYLNKYGRAKSKVSGRPSWKYVPRGWTDWRAAFESPRGHGIHGGTYNYYDTPYNVNGRVDNRYRGEYQTDVVGDFSVDMAARFSAARDPFFMYVNYLAPHHGGPVEKGDPRRVRDANGRRALFTSPARPNWVKGRFNHIIKRGAGMPKGGGPSEADVSDRPRFQASLAEPNAAERKALRNITRQRAESIYVMDRNIARLIKKLKAIGEWDDTVFMFTSDNGYFLGEHRVRQGKVRSNEPSLRVPFLVTGPGLRSAGKRYDPITTVDISATIIDLAGAKAPMVGDGTSRTTSMWSGDQGWRTAVVTESAKPGGGRRAGFEDARTSIGLRTPRYSMTLYRRGDSELYDLEADPTQNTNAWKDPSYRKVREALLDMWWQYKDCAAAECRVPMPTEFTAEPATERLLTVRYWSVIDRVYGW